MPNIMVVCSDGELDDPRAGLDNCSPSPTAPPSKANTTMILALLVGYALRRWELASLDIEEIQMGGRECDE